MVRALCLSRLSRLCSPQSGITRGPKGKAALCPFFPLGERMGLRVGLVG